MKSRQESNLYGAASGSDMRQVLSHMRTLQARERTDTLNQTHKEARHRRARMRALTHSHARNPQLREIETEKDSKGSETQKASSNLPAQGSGVGRGGG
jgi:hypothetical protein